MTIGLGYLSLERESSSLSGGEAQRTRMVRNLGSALTDVTYVFDEPTIGLHAHDVQQMNELLEKLRDKGNTVLVVEHDPEVMRIADHVVDLGRVPARTAAIGFRALRGADGFSTITGRQSRSNRQETPTRRPVRKPNPLHPKESRPTYRPCVSWL